MENAILDAKDVIRLSVAGRVIAQMITAGGLSVMTLNLQDMSDGYFDASWEMYLSQFRVRILDTGRINLSRFIKQCSGS